MTHTDRTILSLSAECLVLLTELQQPLCEVQRSLQVPLLVDGVAQVVQDGDGVHGAGHLSLIQLLQGLNHPQLRVVVVCLRVRHLPEVVAVVHSQNAPVR